MTKSTFEERIKFEHSLTIGKDHPVTLTKNGQKVREVLVYIPNRGFPRVTLKTHVAGTHYRLTIYKIKRDEMIYHGSLGALHAVENFDALVANPETSIEI
jgi:hypothetical protein